MSATTGAASTSLTYDALGRLYAVTKGGSTRRFLYDGDELVAEYDAGGTMLARYIHGSGEDDSLVWYAGNAIAINTYDEYGISVAAYDRTDAPAYGSYAAVGVGEGRATGGGAA